MTRGLRGVRYGSVAVAVLLLSSWFEAGCSAACEFGTVGSVQWDVDHPGPLPTGGTFIVEGRDGDDIRIELECADYDCSGEVDKQNSGPLEMTLIVEGEEVVVDVEELDTARDPRGCEETYIYTLP